MAPLPITVTLAAPASERGHFDTVASAYLWLKQRARDLGMGSYAAQWQFKQ